MLHQREEAEDAAQEALLRAHRDLGRMRDLDRIEAWLVRVVWRLAIDRQRLMRRRRQYELTALAGESQAEPRSASREFEEALHEAVDALPEKLRSVIVLAAIHGYNTAETAKLLGVLEGTVKSRLHSARRKLAEKLARFRT